MASNRPSTAAEKNRSQAPGKPGDPAHWARSNKLGVGTALSNASSVWFTICHGTLTELFYPNVDTACTRDMQFLIAARDGFFSAGKTDTYAKIDYLADGVPAYRLTNTCKKGRYSTVSEILADPRRSVVLLETEFRPKKGNASDYLLFPLLNPHLGNQGAGNAAWLSEFKGIPMLFARHGGIALAFACSEPWIKRSVGYVGVSDGWQDVSRHKGMTWSSERAEDGNVALSGEVDLNAARGKFVLAIAFGSDEYEAAHRARASLLQGFAAARDEYVRHWLDWQKDVFKLKGSKTHPQNLYHISAAVMRTHESKHFPGAVVASLSVPWGFAKGDQDLGYHLVWPRDMIETVVGLLAIDKLEDARRVLFYFQVTQESDGHWPQNMFLDGRHSWNGIQLDETAFVILLVGLAKREKALDDNEVGALWPMVRAAVCFLIRNGPTTPMDRWEEQAGYFASTMAVEIPALLVAADLAERAGERELANYLRETADVWNDLVEELLYARGTELSKDVGVEGYYVRFAKPDQLESQAAAAGYVDLRNHEPGKGRVLVAEVVSPDVLCLVRFGLRAADDPRIVNTVRVIDRVLKIETESGPCWHRYTHDGYGEHADGAPYDGTGVGRAWPLLTGERAHYELAAGRHEESEHLLAALESFANDSGFLPEQIWDAENIPHRELYFGRPSGSAMPLVWAHAEYVKLRRSLYDGRVFDTPVQTVERYLKNKTHSPYAVWRFEQKRNFMPAGKVLRIEVRSPATIRWSTNDWTTPLELKTKDTGLGIHVADLPTRKVPAATTIMFTFFWRDANRWEEKDFRVHVTTNAADAQSADSADAQTPEAVASLKGY
jgi:glucoamylase